MILYLDSSAVVKNYVSEPGSKEVGRALSRAELIGTHLICRVEVAAAFGRAVRMKQLKHEEGWECLRRFRQDWPALVRLQVTEALVVQAEALSWDQELTGFDAIHLAAASLWQGALGKAVTLATFDKRLWRAAKRIGLLHYPDDLV